MSDTSTDNALLRFLISEAIQREIVVLVAPVREQQQIIDGKLIQMNRDLALYQADLRDLDVLVRGNPKLQLVGLAEQLRIQTGQIAEVQRSLTADISNVKTSLTSDISGVKKQLDDADDKREALINQWKGAKVALIALGVVTSLPYLEQLGVLLKLIP